MTQDAGTLLKLADELRDSEVEEILDTDLLERVEAALRQAASQGSAGGERSAVQSGDAKWREALELAKNIIFGSQFAATRERDYAKAAEYQTYIEEIDAALSGGVAQAQIDPGVLSRLRRWRDVGDGPISYCAGGSDFAADVTKLVGAFDTTAVPSATRGTEA